MIQGLETSLRAGVAPQPPQFKPSPVAAVTATQSPPSGSIHVEPKSTASDKTEVDNNGGGIPPAVQPAPVAAATSPAAVAEASMAPPPPVDPLREAKSRVQEEIKREFAAIMATGAVQAGEAAALATRRSWSGTGCVAPPSPAAACSEVERSHLHPHEHVQLYIYTCKNREAHCVNPFIFTLLSEIFSVRGCVFASNWKKKRESEKSRK